MNTVGLKNSDQIKDWFSKERSKLSGKGVWLQGGEPNTLDSKLFKTASIKVLFVRLSAYSDVLNFVSGNFFFNCLN